VIRVVLTDSAKQDLLAAGLIDRQRQCNLMLQIATA
jgi:hypothetical protein